LKGNEPTIIEPEKYKRRFKKAIKKYFIAMCIQNEKAIRGARQVDVATNEQAPQESSDPPGAAHYKDGIANLRATHQQATVSNLEQEPALLKVQEVADTDQSKNGH